MTNLSPLIVKSRQLLLSFAPYHHVIDATVGNGYDSLFLAPFCERIDAIDIQPLAIRRAQERLSHVSQVHLHLDNFINLDHYVSDEVDLIVFNLGFLPGGPRRIRTHVEDTLRAVQKAYDALIPGGHLSIAVYPRHPGGKEELVALKEWIALHQWDTHEDVFETDDTLLWITKR